MSLDAQADRHFSIKASNSSPLSKDGLDGLLVTGRLDLVSGSSVFATRLLLLAAGAEAFARCGLGVCAGVLAFAARS